jgi:hypothetical protein
MARIGVPDCFLTSSAHPPTQALAMDVSPHNSYMQKVYWAHSDPDGLPPDGTGAHWQRLDEHLLQVGALCAKLASVAMPGDPAFVESARVTGLLHDLDKY